MANNLGLGSSTSDSVTIPGLLNPGESPMGLHSDSSFTGYTTFADLGSLNQMQSYGVGYQYGSGERDQLRLERQALQSARNLATQGDLLQSMQAESANYYSQGQANANNPESYLSYTFGGIFSQAGYGLARGAQGLYRLATDTDTKILFANSLVSTWRDPGAVIRSAANGIDQFSRLPFGDQAGAVLKFGLETAATMGAGKLAGMAGDVAVSGARWGVREFGPTLGDMTYNYMSRQGLILNAVPEGPSLGMGANSAAAVDVAATTRQSGFVFRGDARAPDVIFKDGLQPRGTNTDLYEYAANNVPSVYVPTSASPNVARYFAELQDGGYVYTIRGQSAGIDVNATLGKLSPHPNEFEIAVPGGIHPSDIMGARLVTPEGTFTGPFIKNPKYSK